MIDLTEKAELLKLAPHPPLLSSHQARWNKLHLMHFRQPAHIIPECCLAQNIIVIYTGDVGTQISVSGQFNNEFYTRGDLSLFPAHQTAPTTKCHNDAEYINLLIEPTLLMQTARESADLDHVEIIPQLKFRDPLLQHIALELKHELTLYGADSYLYAEVMSISLAVHILRRYTTKVLRLKTYVDGLPTYKLKIAIAYIEDNFDQQLTLNEIASEIQMSSHYFASLFKQSVGITPYQYITNCRIEKAKYLLAHSNLTILDICTQVGFQSQSAFTRTFRKHTSTTPKVYRNSL
ncbi:helix-turn-helix transcriptional regulator [Nostocales cyanobacterium LEGE 11386]|nr:helix-turn-helix transcriptional regulator [Nostocales cyanobacterium LEGE 11386]